MNIAVIAENPHAVKQAIVIILKSSFISEKEDERMIPERFMRKTRKARQRVENFQSQNTIQLQTQLKTNISISQSVEIQPTSPNILKTELVIIKYQRFFCSSKLSQLSASPRQNPYIIAVVNKVGKHTINLIPKVECNQNFQWCVEVPENYWGAFTASADTEVIIPKIERIMMVGITPVNKVSQTCIY